MTRAVVGACCAVALTAIAVSAQDNGMPNKVDHRAMEKTYSGCLESKAGSYSLTQVMTAASKASVRKSHPTMKDSMKKDDGMGKEAMAPAVLSLSAPGKDLSKQVGRRVTVTGSDGDTMNGMMEFKVTSLKMTGKPCS